MAKERRIVDYSRFHEVLINMNPSQQWFDEWCEDAIACEGNIKDFPYFKTIKNDISFFKQVEEMKLSLKREKEYIKNDIKKYPNLKDENFKERLKQCNKCLEMEIDNYEKFEYLNFIYSNITSLGCKEIKTYEEYHKTVRNIITSVFIAKELTNSSLFNSFCKQKNLFVQCLYLWAFAIIVWLGIPPSSQFFESFWRTYPGLHLKNAIKYSFFPEGKFFIAFILIGVIYPGIMAFVISGIPFIFIHLKIKELDSKFINTKLLLLNDINPDDSFKKNSKKIIKTGVGANIILEILSRVFSRK